MKYEAHLKQVKIGHSIYHLIHIPKEVNDLDTWAYPGTKIDVCGDDTSLGILACIFDYVAENKAAAYLDRCSPEGSDLFIFHGRSIPVNLKSAYQIRKTLMDTDAGRRVTLALRPECKEDRMDDHWLFKDSLAVKAEDHMALISGTTPGLRLLAIECKKATQNDFFGHEHFDLWSTKKSAELTIMNKDRDKMPFSSYFTCCREDQLVQDIEVINEPFEIETEVK